MNKYRIVSLLVVIAILATLMVGCAGGDKPGPGPSGTEGGDSPKKFKAACIFNVSDPYNGGGFERMMLEGITSVREELGWQVDIAEGVEFSKIFEVAAGYATSGYDMIFFPGGEFYDAWYELADKYPDTWGVMMSLVPDVPPSGNACAVGGDKFGYGVIVGVVMSMLSETGKIGVVGGMPVGGVLEEFSGIIEGAKLARPECEVLFGWTGEYEDIANHNATTKLLIEKGADVLFTATGPGYKGVWEAASKAGAKVIGYAYDSYNIDPEVVTGSVAYDGPKQYMTFAKGLEDGTLERGFHNFVSYDILKISDFRGKIDAELEKEIRDFCQKIIDREIEVPVVKHDFS